MNYHVTGSVRLGHSKERLQEFKRVVGMGRYQGMDLDILTPDEIKSRYPFAETHDLQGALYDPYDGDIDPAQLTQALAKGARDMGAKIIRFCPVTGVRREKDEWVIETEKGEIRCEFVVNAAGYYAREVGKMFGRDVPMMVMSHQYMLFDTIPELEAWSKESGDKLPLLRDVDSSYYLRQEKYGFNLGPYERNCKAHWITPDDPMPKDFSFQLFPDDLERLEWYLEDAIERVPILGTAGLSKMINGPIPYAPDGNPLIGPMPGVPNAFEACVFTFGICQAGGAGKVLAEWITEGETEWDMWSCDPRRFTSYADQDYCIAKGMEVYGHEYAHALSRSTPGRPVATRSFRRSTTAWQGARRAVQALQWLGTRQLVCASRRRHIRRGNPDMEPRRALGRADQAGMPGRARCCRHSRSARLFALPRQGRGRQRVAVKPDHRPHAQAGPYRSCLFCR